MWCYLEKKKKNVSANSLVDLFTNIVEAPVCRQFGDDIVCPLYNPIVVALRGLPMGYDNCRTQAFTNIKNHQLY